MENARSARRGAGVDHRGAQGRIMVSQRDGAGTSPARKPAVTLPSPVLATPPSPRTQRKAVSQAPVPQAAGLILGVACQDLGRSPCPVRTSEVHARGYKLLPHDARAHRVPSERRPGLTRATTEAGVLGVALAAVHRPGWAQQVADGPDTVAGVRRWRRPRT